MLLLHQLFACLRSDRKYTDGCDFALQRLRYGATPESLVHLVQTYHAEQHFTEGVYYTVLLWRRGQMFFNRSLRRAK